MNEEFVKRVYQTSIEGNIEIYKKMFNNITVDENTIDYWKRASTFYRSLSTEERHTFFEILKTVMTDTISDIFGIIDGSNTLEGGEDLEVTMQIEGQDTELELQDAFLAYIEEIEEIEED